MLDSCIWLAGTPGYPLSETQKVIVDLIMEDEEGGEGISHFDRPILLPDDLENYEAVRMRKNCHRPPPTWA
jgi:hypothetical protein